MKECNGFVSVREVALKWNMSERSVRNYCAEGRVPGAILVGKTWTIPETAKKPNRKNGIPETAKSLLDIIKAEKKSRLSGRIYHKIQIEFTYNSNRIEGSSLTLDQTRYIYETNTIGTSDGILNVDDIIETANHFCCIDMIIDRANTDITESLIKHLHLLLKSGTSESRLDWFEVGDYKKLPNEVCGTETTAPKDVAVEIKSLLNSYNNGREKTFKEILDFHYRFERIHPFQDGNGRVGRLLLFKECLRYGYVPFIIDENLEHFYYRGLKEWERDEQCLLEICSIAQNHFKQYLEYFGIEYVNK